MGNQEDAAVVRRGYEAFNGGDLETLMGLFADDAVYHVGGSGGLAGDNRTGESRYPRPGARARGPGPVPS